MKLRFLAVIGALMTTTAANSAYLKIDDSANGNIAVTFNGMSQIRVNGTYYPFTSANVTANFAGTSPVSIVGNVYSQTLGLGSTVYYFTRASAPMTIVSALRYSGSYATSNNAFNMTYYGENSGFDFASLGAGTTITLSPTSSGYANPQAAAWGVIAGNLDLNVGVAATAAAVGAVPEPATWAMLIGGFGLIGGAMRRRTAKVSFA